MPFELPDYSYGLADSALLILDYMIRTGTDAEGGEAVKCLKDARGLVEHYKSMIFSQVME